MGRVWQVIFFALTYPSLHEAIKPHPTRQYNIKIMYIYTTLEEYMYKTHLLPLCWMTSNQSCCGQAVNFSGLVTIH